MERRDYATMPIGNASAAAQAQDTKMLEKRISDVEQLLRNIGNVPIGGRIKYSYATIPYGWLLCNGQTIPASYPRAIAIIGAAVPTDAGFIIRII